MATTPAEAIELVPSAEHSMRLSAYLDLALDDVVALFARPEIDEILGSAIRAASGTTDARVTMDAAAPVRVSASNAWMPVTWRVTSQEGRVSEGKATIFLLMVQSGHEPVTELLAALTVGDEVAGPIAATAHRFLDELTDRLSALAAT